MHAPPLAHNLDPCLCGCHSGSLGSQHAAAAFHAAKQTKPASRPQCGHQRTLTIDHRAGHGLDRALFQRLTGGEWIERHQDLLVTGPTGTGKTWLSRANRWFDPARSATAPAATTDPCCISACRGCWKRSAWPAATGGMPAC